MQTNHPIPQNVTQYQFRLVGDMTLKQFLELAAGLLAAYIIYASNLIDIFKYPLAIMAGLFGVALAFFPIEDRPLDVWIINFLKAIYGPTRFTWQKTFRTPDLFTYTEQIKPSSQTTTTKTIKAPALPKIETAIIDYSQEELNKLQELNKYLSNETISTTTLAVKDDKPEVVVRKLNKQDEITTPHYLPKPVTTVQDEPQSKLDTVTKPTLNTASSQLRSKDNIVVSENISLPATPQTPNLISGILLDSQGKLVENAIVQIVDQDGIPKRAVKSNPLGQFMISTPLENGNYYIEIEHDMLEFPQAELTLKGQIFTPIMLRATNLLN